MRQSQVAEFGLGLHQHASVFSLLLAAKVFSNSSGQREQADEIVECAGLGYHPSRLHLQDCPSKESCNAILYAHHSTRFDFGHHSVLRIGRRQTWCVQRGQFSDRWRAGYWKAIRYRRDQESHYGNDRRVQRTRPCSCNTYVYT